MLRGADSKGHKERRNCHEEERWQICKDACCSGGVVAGHVGAGWLWRAEKIRAGRGPEGNYHEAWQLYSSLGRKNYRDAEDKAEQVRSTAYQAAKAALAEGRYDDAEAIAEPFSSYTYWKTIVQYAQTAKEGTYVKDLALSEDGKLSFTAAIADGAGGEDGPAILRVLLTASGNGRASGTAYTAPKDEDDTGDGYFAPEDYLEDGEYVIANAPLDGWLYDAAPRSLTIVDYRELADSTLERLQIMQMAHFTLAYTAIMNDGTEGALLSEWACENLMFRDPMKTFAGGTVAVRILSSDGKTILFEQSVDIPAVEGDEKEEASP